MRNGPAAEFSFRLYRAEHTALAQERKEEPMGEIIHQSHITITRKKGPTRKALIKGFGEPVYYGVHGGIKNFYKVDPEEEHAATLDHIVGAVGG